MKYFLFVSVLFLGGLFQSCEEATPEFTISVSATSITVGQSITFSENSFDGLVTNWTFAGGNITTSQKKQETVTYYTPGVYKVTAVVSNASKSTKKEIRIVVHPTYWSYILPGGGVRNNNSTIGDYCCTGETATVNNQENNPLGYVYFYSWRGQAYNTSSSKGSVAPDFDILVSGTTDITGYKDREKARIYFNSSDCYIGKVKRLQIGSLEYTVKILNIEAAYGTSFASTHFFMGSLRVFVQVRWVG